MALAWWITFSKQRLGTVAKIMDDVASSQKPSLWQAASGRCCLYIGQVHRAGPYALTSLQQRQNRPSQISTPQGKQFEGSRQLGKPISQICGVCWQIAPLLARFPLFKATVRNICNVWESESNCQNRHRKSRKAVQGSHQKTPEIGHNQSSRGHATCNTRHTMCPLERRQKTAFYMHHSEAGTCRDQSGHPAVLTICGWNHLSLPPT